MHNHKLLFGMGFDSARRDFALLNGILPCQTEFCLVRRNFALLDGILPCQTKIPHLYAAACPGSLCRPVLLEYRLIIWYI
ncbi:hypothetical protein CBFG_04746 [Clostridiales bacterium 1_7_47FAA]|nr:hypothetical protein CBFG_04746 [Clostridiales bacterium 1_7_47FAA]